MKKGYLLKGEDTDAGAQELEQINRYTRREVTAQEVYLFSVVLCDNDIDRDCECFSREALDRLAVLFVGKTGIFNHDMKSENQTARIFSCKVEQVMGQTTQTGAPYYRLTARAYMSRTQKNADLIEELECGIKKEVSVGCAVGKASCSVCGADFKAGGCAHVKGKQYGTQICYAVLDNPTDAYEWSFVAVPAQRQAGVIKAYHPDAEGGETSMEEMMKSIRQGQKVTLSEKESIQLGKYLETLEQQAQDGKEYRSRLQREVVRLSAMVQPELTGVMENVAKHMELNELLAFQKSYAQKAEALLPPKPQLTAMRQKETVQSGNAEFKI